MFFITLHALVAREQSITAWMSQLLVLVDPHGDATTALEDNLISVIFCTAKLTLFHALLTWLSFSVLGAPLVYMSTFATALLTVVPVVPPMWIALPPALALWLVDGRMWAGIALMAVHMFAAWFVDGTLTSRFPPRCLAADAIPCSIGAFYALIPDVNPYFSAMGFLLGLWAFGLEGLILGPLLMSVLPTILAIVSSRLSADEAATSSDPISPRVKVSS